jgi:outer membrane cobalamin receptor
MLWSLWLAGLWTATAGAQTPTVTVRMKHVALETVLAELERQTGLFFSYESSLTEGLPRVSLEAGGVSPEDCLKRLFAPLPIAYRITGQHVILKRKPPQYTVSGFVRDSATFEGLVNATVHDGVSGLWTTSDYYGFFTLKLPSGRVQLSSSYVGYVPADTAFTLDRDTLIDLLPAASMALAEVEVRKARPHPEVMNSRVGNVSFSSAQLLEIPVLFGEPDLLRALRQVPGIASGTEIPGGMFVRGGNDDENLFLIDGVPVYNANHAGGLFSTFNSDVVREIDFYKGGFPARYGGRLSSVADVKMKDGDMQDYHATVSIGLLAARIALEGPVVKDRTSFAVAFRRTWFDAVTSPFFAIANMIDKEYQSFAGYSFYDLNARVNHAFSPGNRLCANFYMGQDRLRYADWQYLPDMETQPLGEEFTWRWGNLVSSLNWTNEFAPGLTGRTGISFSRFHSKMMHDEARSSFLDASEAYPLKLSYTANLSGIEDLSCRTDFDYAPRPAHRIHFGAAYTFHRYRPEERMTRIRLQDAPVYERSYPDARVYAGEWSAYAEDDWTAGERWRINAGGHFAAYLVGAKTYASFQPRLSLRYLVDGNFSLKASYAKMNQYVHRLSNTYAQLPSEIWVPVTAKVKPMTSHLLSAGAYCDFRRALRFSIEGYYRRLYNLIEYQDNALLYPDYYRWDERIATGDGRAWGVELMARKTEGRTSGWAAYTLSWADRIFADHTVNGGRRFPARYDNRHKLNLTAIHRLTPRIDLAASWMYASGNRVTIPVDRYTAEPDADSSRPGYENVPGRNAARLSDYHRLDLSLNIYRPQKRGRMAVWNISVYNVYSRLNPFYVEYTTMNARGEYTLTQKGLIPVIPSVSYTYIY